LDYKKLLIRLADQLDEEGKSQLADIIDENWLEFLKLLEDGKLNFNYQFHGTRNPNNPYSNRGGEVPACGA